MRYFFLIYALLLALVLLALPNRFGKSSQTEWRVFPDMDEQDKLLGQRSSNFFADGRGARIPDANAVPMGFKPLTKENSDELPEFGFTNGNSYVFTGKGGEGMPKELGIKTVNDARQLLAHGEERYQINCAHCHGDSADGKGVAIAGKFSGIANLMTSTLNEGQVFDKITNGGPIMLSLKHQTSIKDRWAIVAYLNALKDAKAATEASKEEAAK